MLITQPAGLLQTDLFVLPILTVLIFNQPISNQHIFTQPRKGLEISEGLGTLPTKKTGFFGNFSQVSDPPVPPFWEPEFSKKKVWFILHFRPLGAFLVFTNFLVNFTFGNRCPPKKLPVFTFGNRGPPQNSLFLILGIGDPPKTHCFYFWE